MKRKALAVLAAPLALAGALGLADPVAAEPETPAAAAAEAEVGEQVAMTAVPAENHDPEGLFTTAVTHTRRYQGVGFSTGYIYDIWLRHWDHGVNTVDVYRFDQTGQYYLAHALHVESYDFVAFPAYTFYNRLAIYLFANAVTDCGQAAGGECTFPWYTVNPEVCLPYHVYNRNGVFYGLNPSYAQCPYSGGGTHAYDALAPFRENFQFHGSGSVLPEYTDYYELL